MRIIGTRVNVMVKRFFLALAILGVVAGAAAFGAYPASACSYSQTHTS